MTKKVQAYIDSMRKRGRKDQHIKDALHAAGHSPRAVKKHLKDDPFDRPYFTLLNDFFMEPKKIFAKIKPAETKPATRFALLSCFAGTIVPAVFVTLIIFIVILFESGWLPSALAVLIFPAVILLALGFALLRLLIATVFLLLSCKVFSVQATFKELWTINALAHAPLFWLAYIPSVNLLAYCGLIFFAVTGVSEFYKIPTGKALGVWIVGATCSLLAHVALAAVTIIPLYIQRTVLFG